MFILLLEKRHIHFHMILFSTYLKFILEYNSKLDNERENTMVMIVWIIDPLGINERIITQL